MEITLITICRNEAQSGHLTDFLNWNPSLFDHLVAYDDSSTDETVSLLESSGFDVFKNDISFFRNELFIRERLLNFARELYPMTRWFVILDSDELLLASREELENLVQEAEGLNCDGISFNLVNLWKSKSQFRTDEFFNRVRKVHAWRNHQKMEFSRESGLHKELHPTSIRRILEQKKFAIVHLGFASPELIVKKYLAYKKLGQKGRMLWRLIDERDMQLESISSIQRQLGTRASDWIVRQIEIFSGKTHLNEYLWEARRIEKNARHATREKPIVTLISLIYAGVDWLEFAYGELLTLQRELEDGVADILFCANDPSNEVVEFLKSNAIPHVIFRNTNPSEHYLSRVYRAYNHAVAEATGEYCLLVNSDMAYSQGFLTRMLDKRSAQALVVGQLVESGTLKPGPLAIKKNFGRKLRDFNREKFNRFASRVTGPETKNGGLFMPLLVKRDTFLNLGSFPEGNLVPGALPGYLDGNDPVISSPGESCVSGDAAFFQKAEKSGIKHLTITHAVAYHFQEGEKRHASNGHNSRIHSGVAIANDSLNGINNERVLWNVLVDLLRDTGIRVLEWNTGKVRFTLISLRKRAQLNFNPQGNPRVKLQNATYLPPIGRALRNIALLQDNVDAKRLKRMQEKVFVQSDTIVTNSISMIDLDAASHYIWQPLPINDLWIETPLPKRRKPLRTIFVGALDSTKGWEDVKSIIRAYPKIEFVVVSKYEEDLEARLISELPNVEVFNRLSQNELVQLMDSCEIFLLGSPFETQCLAAMEAAMRNLAIVMRPTGMLSEAPNSEEFGYFSQDLAQAFELAVNDYSKGLHKSPRKAMSELKLSARQIEQEWLDILTTELKESFRPLNRIHRNLTTRIINRIFGTKRIYLDA
jgi:glycosyltransferase involved in cell wall biosynthesis